MAKDNLTRLLSQLNVHSAQGESSKVQETCVELLENGCSEPGSILKNLLVSIIQQDAYQLGLDMLKNYKHIDEKFGSEFALEKLYIFYKLNKLKEFQELYSVLNPTSIDTVLKQNERQTAPLRGVLHVRAQFCYKNGFYDEAFKIYHYLATHNEKGIDDELELACNVRAPLTVTPELRSNLKLPLAPEDSSSSYDLMFNDSMIQCSLGLYDESLELLTKAHELAKQEGNESDLDAIQLQLAYVYQLKGDKVSCKQNLNDLLNRSDSSSPINLLAKNNLGAFQDFSKYTTNLNLTLRELNVENFTAIDQKHFTKQQWLLLHNNFLFLHLFNNNNIQPKSTIVSRTLSNYKSLVEDINLETYSTQAKKAYHHAITMIKSTVEGSTIGFVLLAVQLLVVQKEWDNAIRLGEMFLNKCWENSKIIPDGKHHIVCYILFLLYSTTARGHSKTILLQKLANETKVLPRDVEFWKHVSFQYLECGDLKNSRKLLKQITGYIPDDEIIRQVLADDDLNVENGYEITSGIDVAALVGAGVTPLESNRIKKDTRSNKIQKKRLDIRKKRRAQKAKKLLATRTVTRSLDPERWLPLKDRSTYRPKKKQQGKQTQGGAMNKKAEQFLDISKKSKKSNASKGKKKSRK
ncbi:hypothetical protein ZYGR_0P02790 [Zygosaccharomyces rouxii]|uniref:Signal recognition particle subunit SRP72 n=1 Tax=Zygosaccharomyces rouxii TaxID=4956 RepID=A0A1Q3A1M8_ZYGRO|nr:hypothetical protein ZYGR_0P02790 [Zygosaccharomyces rouxii]